VVGLHCASRQRITNGFTCHSLRHTFVTKMMEAAGNDPGWAAQHGVTLEFIKPGKPMQNGFIERFNRSYREACSTCLCFKA
jgi:hypothetical protein